MFQLASVIVWSGGHYTASNDHPVVAIVVIGSVKSTFSQMPEPFGKFLTHHIVKASFMYPLHLLPSLQNLTTV